MKATLTIEARGNLDRIMRDFEEFLKDASDVRASSNDSWRAQFEIANEDNLWCQDDLLGEFLSEHYVSLSCLDRISTTATLVPFKNDFGDTYNWDLTS